jgi:hypothetical protein
LEDGHDARLRLLVAGFFVLAVRVMDGVPFKRIPIEGGNLGELRST